MVACCTPASTQVAARTEDQRRHTDRMCACHGVAAVRAPGHRIDDRAQAGWHPGRTHTNSPRTPALTRPDFDVRIRQLTTPHVCSASRTRGSARRMADAWLAPLIDQHGAGRQRTLPDAAETAPAPDREAGRRPPADHRARPSTRESPSARFSTPVHRPCLDGDSDQVTRSLRLGDALPEYGLLGWVGGQFQRAAVGGASLVGVTELAQELGVVGYHLTGSTTRHGQSLAEHRQLGASTAGRVNAGASRRYS